ncbi:MAG: adenylosuccinate synthase, partial [Actinomycetota bacterium]
EVETLESRGVSCARLRVSSRAHLIFPWHQAHDALAEGKRGDDKIGTTLKGIGPAYADKARRVGIRAGEVLDAAAFADTVRRRANEENAALAALGGAALDVEAIVAQFTELARRIASYVADTVNELHDALDEGADILLEGAQATFLDIDHGTYPYVTSSNPVSGGACAGTGLGPRDITRVVGIAKAYTTRVGSGPFPTELVGADGEPETLGQALIDIGHEYGTVTGRRRRTGWLDLVMLRHAVRVNSLTEIALTKLDVLDTFDEVKVCTDYRRVGVKLGGYPDLIDVLAEVEPLYTTLPGWKTTLRGAKTDADLHPHARALIDLVERNVGVPVTMVGTGPERDDCVVR